jgi:phage gp45-like
LTTKNQLDHEHPNNVSFELSTLQPTQKKPQEKQRGSLAKKGIKVKRDYAEFVVVIRSLHINGNSASVKHQRSDSTFQARHEGSNEVYQMIKSQLSEDICSMGFA